MAVPVPVRGLKPEGAGFYPLRGLDPQQGQERIV